jgi:hypothetical protein
LAYGTALAPQSIIHSQSLEISVEGFHQIRKIIGGLYKLLTYFHRDDIGAAIAHKPLQTITSEVCIMNRHLLQGIIVGVLFALPVTWIAASDALAVGSFPEILASVVFGLAAGLCVGALIAANFAMLALEENEPAVAHRHVEAHAHA